MSVRIPSAFFARGAGPRRRPKTGDYKRVAPKHRRSDQASTGLEKSTTLPTEIDNTESKRLRAVLGIRIGCAEPGVTVGGARQFLPQVRLK